MTKTAVEWLAKELYEKMEMKGDGEVFDKILEQAKEMEKQQIIYAYNQGCLDTLKDGMKRGGQYYNETFNK